MDTAVLWGVLIGAGIGLIVSFGVRDLLRDLWRTFARRDRPDTKPDPSPARIRVSFDSLEDRDRFLDLVFPNRVAISEDADDIYEVEQGAIFLQGTLMVFANNAALAEWLKDFSRREKEADSA